MAVAPAEVVKEQLDVSVVEKPVDVAPVVEKSNIIEQLDLEYLTVRSRMRGLRVPSVESHV